MARYVRSEEALEAKIRFEEEKFKYDRDTNDLRKRRELMRRQVHAALYEPKLCMGDPVTAQTCRKHALPGAGFCADHGGTTKMMQTAARTRLLYLVEPALRVMNKCMASGDLNVALKAAQIVLDRAGFHPHATLEIEEKAVDYATMSNMQLRNRAQKLIDALDQMPADNASQVDPDMLEVEPILEIIDVPPSTDKKVH